jgi:quercetin dioxygenase-like cupin family protein
MANKEATLFHLAPADPAAPPLDPGSILSQALLQNEHVKVVRFRFAKGQELSEHTATVGAMIHQVAGRAQWTLGDHPHAAQPGDWAWMPANLPHSIHATEDSEVLLLLLKGAKETPATA